VSNSPGSGHSKVQSCPLTGDTSSEPDALDLLCGEKSKQAKRQLQQDVEVSPVDVKRIERLLGRRFRRGWAMSTSLMLRQQAV